MDYIIDNLSTREISKFTEIEPKMLNITEKHSLDQVQSNAYYTATNRKQGRQLPNQKQGRQPNRQPARNQKDF